MAKFFEQINENNVNSPNMERYFLVKFKLNTKNHPWPSAITHHIYLSGPVILVASPKNTMRKSHFQSQ